MRKALIVGINEYVSEDLDLFGCVEDASQIKMLLDSHANGDPNFECKLLTNPNFTTTRNLKSEVKELFKNSKDIEIALFYFSGHGFVNETGGFLIASDTNHAEEGISMNELQTIINQSNIKNKVIILDCCFSGAQGVLPDNYGLSDNSLISSGTTILTAARKDEVSLEVIDNKGNFGGVFTKLLLEALRGGATDILGNITPASVYSYIDKALGPWSQRPIFKTNISKFVSLRNAQPLIDKERLRNITKYFKTPNDLLKLDPSFEHTSESANLENVNILKDLQKYRDAGLVVPVDEEHLYYSAVNSKSCRLTAIGLQYWKLVDEQKI